VHSHLIAANIPLNSGVVSENNDPILIIVTDNATADGKDAGNAGRDSEKDAAD
jgi:hypothetical protein